MAPTSSPNPSPPSRRSGRKRKSTCSPEFVYEQKNSRSEEPDPQTAEEVAQPASQETPVSNEEQEASASQEEEQEAPAPEEEDSEMESDVDDDVLSEDVQGTSYELIPMEERDPPRRFLNKSVRLRHIDFVHRRRPVDPDLKAKQKREDKETYDDIKLERLLKQQETEEKVPRLQWRIDQLHKKKEQRYANIQKEIQAAMYRSFDYQINSKLEKDKKMTEEEKERGRKEKEETQKKNKEFGALVNFFRGGGVLCSGPLSAGTKDSPGERHG